MEKKRKISNHPFSSLSQSQSQFNGAKKSKENMKPFSKADFVPRKPIFQGIVNNNMQKTSNYDQQNYDNNKNVNLTTNNNQQRRGILKTQTNSNRSNIQANKSFSKQNNNSRAGANEAKKANENRNDDATENIMQLKIFSGTIKSVKFITRKFDLESNDPKKAHVGNYIFEIIARLDSSVYENRQLKSKEFTVADQYDRMSCIYHEIDQTMGKLIQGSFVRLVGSFHLKSQVFKCFKAKSATEDELFVNAQNITNTNEFIKKKYC